MSESEERCPTCGQRVEPKVDPPARPDRPWRVGDYVRYVKDMEWACTVGTRGVIVRQDESRDIPEDPDAYQVFWVSPIDEDTGKLQRRAPVWWTTPSDVEYVEKD